MDEKKWYVVNTYSGHENKVKEKLEMRANSMDMQENIFRVIVPEQKFIETKDGHEKEKIKKLFPGYILVEMIMTDEAWFIVRNTPGVTGFIGSSGKGAKPTPLQDFEVENILKNIDETSNIDENELGIGDKIRIIAGPFVDMTGTVENIDLENKMVNASVDLFGQETSIEVEFAQIRKI